MKKVKLIVDSSSAISKAEADKLGIGFIPLGITLDGQPMRSGVDIDAMQVYERMLKKPKVSTSLPLGSDIINAFDEALKDHDMAIVVSMSHKMSGTNNSLRLMAEEDKYKGKIFVYPGLYLSP
jgi:fatty acid-binding protein DegV